jgi:hypothetical protein
VKLFGCILIAAIALTLAPSRAQAEVRRPDRIELGRITPRVAHLPSGFPDLASPHWDDEGPRASAIPLPCSAYELRGPIRLVLPEIGPEGLDLRIRYQRFEFCVGADMGDGARPMAARIDCSTALCYFWVRANVDLTPDVSVYVESFQGATTIVGSTLPTPRFAWDGFQIQPGAQIRLSHAWTLEGGPVFYTFSETRQRGGIGGRIGFRWEF